MKKITILILISVISLMSLTACGGRFGGTSYDLQSFFKPLTVTGYSDNLSLTEPEIDYDMLDTVDDEDYAGMSELLQTVEFTLEPVSDVSNGDYITITANWDEDMAADYKIGFTNTEWDIEVSGIRERVTEEDIDDLFSEGSETLYNCREMILNCMHYYLTHEDGDGSDVNIEMEGLYFIKDIEATEVRTDWRPGIEGEVYLDRYAVVFRVNDNLWYVMTCDYVLDKEELAESEPKFTGIPEWADSYETAMEMLKATSTDELVGTELIQIR